MYSLSVPEENNSHKKLDKNKEIERLISTYGKDVLRTSFLYLKDRHRAEDAFQEVFIKVYNGFESFENKSSEKTWIIRITINVCKDILKSSWIKRVFLVDKIKPDKAYSGIDNRIIKSDENRMLFDAVMSLSQEFKDVVILYYYQEFSTAETGKILSIPEGTVRSRLYRARLVLKDILGERIDIYE